MKQQCLKDLGHKVYIGCRDEAKAKKVSSALGVEYIIIDVSSDESVGKAVDNYMQKETHLDILINNAGIPGGRNAPQDITADMMSDIYNINVFES